MSTVIRVENLSKHYKLGTINHGVLFRDIQSAWARFRGKPDPNMTIDQQYRSRLDHRSFWALRDISMDIRQGEVLGIIGRNGAGKSTLLKLLSRVTAPTDGQIKIRGRIASLLEVGTGFHPELTGRENIYLNGAILGMTKQEIRKKFDEIVAFSDLSAFIDTPVKRYSSGMYVRLAFAVAAHLESEILIVDEVLAVGDAEFQKKCLGKMGDVSRQGRTVLFVSHQMSMLTGLCDTGLLLARGEIAYHGSIQEAVRAYYSHQNGNSDVEVIYEDKEGRPGNAAAQLHSGRILGNNGVVQYEHNLDGEIAIEMVYEILRSEQRIFVPNFHIRNQAGSYVFVANTPDMQVLPAGRYSATCKIPGNLLNDDTYSVDLALTAYDNRGGWEVCFTEMSALMFSVTEDLRVLAPERYNYAGRIPGVIRPKLIWQFRKI